MTVSQKTENCVNYLLASGFDFTPDSRSADLISYRFRLHRNDLTAEGAENAEGENTEMNNPDATGFDIIPAAPELI